MTISEIIRESAKLHMSYGEYVQKYDPPKTPPPPEPRAPNHVCPQCGKAFYAKYKTRVYCDACRVRKGYYR